MRRLPQALDKPTYDALEAAGSIRRPLTWGPMGVRKDRTPDPEGLVSLTDIAAAAVAGDL